MAPAYARLAWSFRKLGWSGGIGALLWVALGCAAQRPEIRAALTGDLAELKREVAQAQLRGEITRERLTELARAVARREVASARGGIGAQQLRRFRACLKPLQRELEQQARERDEAAAMAAMLLLESGQRDPTALVSEYSKDERGAFRALAARSSLSPREAELRRRYFLDPDERVRRAALEAALHAPRSSELEALLEAARLDPAPQSRARAVQAVGRIGGERAVLGLMDLFAAADEHEQLSILEAWSRPQSFGHGGERELSRALSRPGLVSVSAASLLLGSRDSRTAALAVLARAIETGSDDERRVALSVAPVQEPAIRDALLAASKSPSPELTPLILLRLSEVPGRASEARKQLEALARDKGDSGLEAVFALAQLGSMTATARLEQELSHPSAARRRRAALMLARLGKLKGLSLRLADDDPSLRAELACQLLEAR
jgi:HEAT repeat protein